mgnify:CR=1 FL=1
MATVKISNRVPWRVDPKVGDQTNKVKNYPRWILESTFKVVYYYWSNSSGIQAKWMSRNVEAINWF